MPSERDTAFQRHYKEFWRVIPSYAATSAVVVALVWVAKGWGAVAPWAIILWGGGICLQEAIGLKHGVTTWKSLGDLPSFSTGRRAQRWSAWGIAVGVALASYGVFLLLQGRP